MNKGMVVAPHGEAADIAGEILGAGGNAFDALVAGAFAQGVVDPHRCGIGGFGAAILYSAEESRVWSLSFHGRAGSRARPGMWEGILEGAAPDGFGYILDGKVNDVGYQSITVPGTVAGLMAIHERFGRMPWAELLAALAELARRGFLVVPGMHAFWRRPGLFGRVSTGDRLGLTAEGRSIWLKDGEPPRTGDVARQENLAATYEHLAQAGPGDFYKGELARKMATDWQDRGALVTYDDLSSYRARWEEPLKGSFLGREIFSSPLPGGGVALFQALGLARSGGLLELGWNSAPYVDLLGRIFSAVQHDRVSFHSDPEFGAPDVAGLLSEAYLEKMLQSHDRKYGTESPDTTEIALVDRLGNAVAFSHSLGYGSGVFTDGLGFMYNNCMSGFDPLPGNPNSIAPGKARSTAIAQTMVLRDGAPELVVGSPGGSHITAGLTQALLNFLHYGMDLQDAVCRPRLDAYRDTLLLESRMPYKLEDSLGAKWQIKRSPSPFGMVGRIYGVAFTERGLRPGYDPGEPGKVVEA